MSSTISLRFLNTALSFANWSHNWLSIISSICLFIDFTQSDNALNCLVPESQDLYNLVTSFQYAFFNSKASVILNVPFHRSSRNFLRIVVAGLTEDPFAFNAVIIESAISLSILTLPSTFFTASQILAQIVSILSITDCDALSIVEISHSITQVLIFFIEVICVLFYILNWF